jgi:hypothetical protein
VTYIYTLDPELHVHHEQVLVKRGLQLTFLSLGFGLLAWKALLPCYVTIAACYVSQTICAIDRTFFSASMNPLCKLVLASHSPDHLHHTPSPTCPTTILWAVKPYVSHTLRSLWKQPPVSFYRNYASYGGGADILRGYTSKTHDLPSPTILGSLAESIFGYNPQYANVNGAGIILEESMGVGECWRISGGTGHVAINLSEAVFISHIAMDYASPILLSQDDIASAPKNMALWAFLPPADDAEYKMPIRSMNDFKLKKYGRDDFPMASRLLQIINFQYDISKQPTRQIFQVPVRMHFPVRTIVLEITTNEGSDTSCIYWLGIYGSRSIS